MLGYTTIQKAHSKRRDLDTESNAARQRLGCLLERPEATPLATFAVGSPGCSDFLKVVRNLAITRFLAIWQFIYELPINMRATKKLVFRPAPPGVPTHGVSI